MSSWIPTSLIAVLVAEAMLAIFFHRRQNEGTRMGTAVGGEISWVKSFWLFYALFSWFVVPLIFFLDPNLPHLIRWMLAIHLVIWWTRGVLEKWMIYRWFNWSPLYGITHDLLHAALLAVFILQLSHFEFPWDSTARFAFDWICITLFATLAEALFAALFLKARGGAKNHLIYFASNDPVYSTINRVTAVVVVIVYGQMIRECWHAARAVGWI